MKFNLIWEGEPPEITEDQKLLLGQRNSMARKLCPRSIGSGISCNRSDE